jgi:hypothetical protein
MASKAAIGTSKAFKAIAIGFLANKTLALHFHNGCHDYPHVDLLL